MEVVARLKLAGANKKSISSAPGSLAPHSASILSLAADFRNF